MLEKVAEGVWCEGRPLRFFGVELGTRMTVVRLTDGSLFVHSPVGLGEGTRESVEALGRVRAVVAPSLFHHMFVGEWVEAFPEAAVYACPGLEKKRRDVKWGGVLGDEAQAEWRGEIDQVFFGAWGMANEVVFFHRESRTIVSSDFMFNLGTHPSGMTRVLASLAGQRKPGVTLLEKLLIRDRTGAKEQVGRIVGWGAERVVLAHGDILTADGAEAVRNAYAWL